jgi:hypothetical protein
MKIELELNIIGDGRIFLNFWDFTHGRDVCAEIVNGLLYVNESEVSLQEFIDEVISNT